MGQVFSERHKFDVWLRIELAVAEGWTKHGRIKVADYMRLRQKAKFNLTRMRHYESKVEHEVVAFTSTVAESIGDLSRYFHLGLTSSDVMDTALSIQMQEAWGILLPEVSHLAEAIGALALKHKRTVMIGRTHGIHAEPITFGLKALIWYLELKRDLERLERARDETAYGKLSGSVGNYAHVPPELEADVLAKLNLKPEPVSNQIVQRDRHAAALSALALLAGTIERIAVEIRSLQRTEIGELAEPFMAGQKGSSSMPHKRNPVLCERMSGMARLIRGYAQVGFENQVLWNERDISHSSAERVAVADAFTAADYMVAKMTGIIEGLVVNPRKMEENIGLTKGLIFSQRLMLALAEKGLSREESYRLVQEPAMKAFDEGKHFYNLVKESREIRKHLSMNELSDVFSVEPYLKHVDAIFTRAGLSEAKKQAAPSGDKPPAKRTRRGGRRRSARKPAASS
jgi:adenylosuccinate lyase